MTMLNPLLSVIGTIRRINLHGPSFSRLQDGFTLSRERVVRNLRATALFESGAAFTPETQSFRKSPPMWQRPQLPATSEAGLR